MSGLDDVRRALDHPEDVEPVDLGQDQNPAPLHDAPPDGPEHPHDDGGVGEPGAPPDGGAPDDDFAEMYQEAAKFPLNDLGNGQRFNLYFGEDLMWVPRVAWFRWNGQFWKEDPDMIEVRRRAQKVSGLISKEIPHLTLDPWDMDLMSQAGTLNEQRIEIEGVEDPDEDQQADLIEINRKLNKISILKKYLSSKRADHHKFARAAGNTTRIAAAINEGEIDLARVFEDLNKSDLDINTKSGVLRFSVDGGAGAEFSRVADVQLHSHKREQLLTKFIPCEYDPTATAPEFDKFLERIQPELEMREFLQRWFGLSMTGLLEQKLVFLYGDGANGKSVLVDLMSKILGNYSATAKIESITGKNRRSGGDATPDLIPLMGARMVRASEPEKGEPLQEGKIKELTGGEPMLVRGLHADFVEMQPKFKLTISGNHKPEIRGNDEGIWRRVLLVPFGVQIPKNEQDLQFGPNLFASEAPGILNWLVTGLLTYLEGGLQEPARVTEATQEFRDESDPIGMFLTDATNFTGEPADVIQAAVLVEAFNYWLTTRGETRWKGTTIARQLAKKDKVWKHPGSGRAMMKGKSGLSQYWGVRFTDTFKAGFDERPSDGRPQGFANARSDEP